VEREKEEDMGRLKERLVRVGNSRQRSGLEE